MTGGSKKYGQGMNRKGRILAPQTEQLTEPVLGAELPAYRSNDLPTCPPIRFVSNCYRNIVIISEFFPRNQGVVREN